jgi:hypothetical protein
MSRDEQVLMRLTEVDCLPWKQVAVKFREETGKAMKVPALQMRKKRLVERLRVWTVSDVLSPLLERNASFQDLELTLQRKERLHLPSKIRED